MATLRFGSTFNLKILILISFGVMICVLLFYNRHICNMRINELINK